MFGWPPFYKKYEREKDNNNVVIKSYLLIQLLITLLFIYFYFIFFRLYLIIYVWHQIPCHHHYLSCLTCICHIFIELYRFTFTHFHIPLIFLSFRYNDANRWRLSHISIYQWKILDATLRFMNGIWNEYQHIKDYYRFYFTLSLSIFFLVFSFVVVIFIQYIITFIRKYNPNEFITIEKCK